MQIETLWLFIRLFLTFNASTMATNTNNSSGNMMDDQSLVRIVLLVNTSCLYALFVDWPSPRAAKTLRTNRETARSRLVSQTSRDRNTKMKQMCHGHWVQYYRCPRKTIHGESIWRRIKGNKRISKNYYIVWSICFCTVCPRSLAPP